MLRGLYLWTFDGYENVDGNLVPKAIMQGLRFNGDGTTLNTFGTVNIGGTIIFDASGVAGTYTVAADCTGTLSPAPGIAPSFQHIRRAGCTAGLDSSRCAPDAGDGTGVSMGTAVRLP